MLAKLSKILFLSALLAFVTSCSEYAKIQREEDPQKKFEYACKLFEQEKYPKVIKLMEPIYLRFRQTKDAEMADWIMAYSMYKRGSYDMASYMLNNFAKEYPLSEKNKEAAFLGAVASYKLSPESYLDQEYTEKAITMLQRYIDNYPTAENISEADKMVRELNAKLEKKAYDIAYNYYRMEEYNAAIVAFSNVLDDMPSTIYREDIMFNRLKAAAIFANKSIADKQKERYTDAITYGRIFLKQFPKSKYSEEAEAIIAALESDSSTLDKVLKNIGKDEKDVKAREIKKQLKKENKSKGKNGAHQSETEKK